MKRQTVLVIASDASITGAPLLLINYLEWIKSNSKIQFVFIFREGGELINRYKKLGPIYSWNSHNLLNTNKFSNNFIYRVQKKIYKSKLFIYYNLLKIRFKYDIKLVLSNTATNGHLIPFILKIFKKKIITYVHEGERVLEKYNIDGAVNYCLNNSNELIVVSETIKNLLIEKFKINQKINLVPGGFDFKYKLKLSSQELKKQYNIKNDSLIILSCGTLSWHKGADYFIQIANKILKSNTKSIYFIWVGCNPNAEVYKQLMFDVKMLNIERNIMLLPIVENNLEYINIADIFLMLSREESFSLVTLEASALKKPIICFDKAGGPCEILNYNKELIVPYADLNHLESRINKLLDSESDRIKIGEEIYEHVFNKYEYKKHALKLLEILQKNISIN